MMNINQKQLQRMMSSLGVKHEEIKASEVIIRCEGKDLIVKEPKITKMNMMGQEMLQISGKIIEKGIEKIDEEDIKLVMEQANVDRDKAKEILEKNKGDIAKSILDLKKV